MFSHVLKKLPKNSFEIQVKIPFDDISKQYELSFTKIHSEFAFEGFRKGKVPKAIAQKQISKETVYQHLIRDLLPKIYEEIIKKEGLKPIISPKIDLVRAKENEEWEVKITLAIKPDINLGNYKEIIKTRKLEQKKDEIWIPGKSEEKKKEEASPEKDRQTALNNVLTALLKEAKCEIPDLLIEEELNQRLTGLVDEIQKIGLTVEAYLKSKQTTLDQLKARLTQEIADMYRIEFILSEIADKENIKVEDTDLQKLFSTITDAKERDMAKTNSYYYASLLRKQKTFDYLIDL